MSNCKEFLQGSLCKRLKIHTVFDIPSAADRRLSEEPPDRTGEPQTLYKESRWEPDTWGSRCWLSHLHGLNMSAEQQVEEGVSWRDTGDTSRPVSACMQLKAISLHFPGVFTLRRCCCWLPVCMRQWCSPQADSVEGRRRRGDPALLHVCRMDIGNGRCSPAWSSEPGTGRAGQKEHNKYYE